MELQTEVQSITLNHPTDVRNSQYLCAMVLLVEFKKD